MKAKFSPNDVAEAFFDSAQQFKTINTDYKVGVDDLPKPIEAQRENVWAFFNEIASSTECEEATLNKVYTCLSDDESVAELAASSVADFRDAVNDLVDSVKEMRLQEKNGKMSPASIDDEQSSPYHAEREVHALENDDTPAEALAEEDTDVDKVNALDDFEKPRPMQILIDDPDELDEEESVG